MPSGRNDDRARRGRGHAARLCALDRRRPRPDGARRSPVPCAGCMHRRPLHRGQTRTGRLHPSRDPIQPLLVEASAWALGLTAQVIEQGKTARGAVGQLAHRIGTTAVRAAARQAMQLIGNHFVFGETIEPALSRGLGPMAGRPRFSFDMLGEGARTAADAERYLAAYARRSMPSVAHAGMSPPGAPAFRSNSRRCIRATNPSRAAGS